MDIKDDNGDTAHSLALMCGYVKIASLIGLHTAPLHKSVRRDTGGLQESQQRTADCSRRGIYFIE